MLRKAVLWLLVVGWFPGCVGLPPVFPPEPPPQAAQAEQDLFQQGEAAYRRQAYREAWQHFAAYLERYPQGSQAPQVRLRLAELAGIQGDWEGSLRRYQAMVTREPSPEVTLKARYGMGRAYFKLGQYQQAIQVLDSLTATDLPRSLWFSTQALLCEIALKQNQVTQAFSRLRLAAQDLPSGDQEWFEDLKTRLVEQATPQELESLATLYRDTPLSAALLLRLARLAQEAGRVDEAQRWLATLKERFPQSPEATAGERLLMSAKRSLGVLLPLSGDYAGYGRRVKQGMELGARQSPVQLIFRDTANDPHTAAQMVRNLAQDPNLLAILGPLTSGAAQSAAEAAQTSGVPLMALTQKAGLTQTGDLIFQAFLTARQQVRALVRRTSGTMGIKRYFVLYPDSPYGRTFLQQFQEEVAAQGGQIVAQESYSPGNLDFAPFLTALREAAPLTVPPTPEALFIPDDPAVVAAIAGQLAASPLRGVQLLGTNLLNNPQTPPAQLQALEGALFPDGFFAGDPNPAVQNFINAYRQQYGEAPDYLATQGYLAVKVLGRVLETDSSVSRATLPRQLMALRAFPELPWFQAFNPAREAEEALYILTLKNGQVQMAPPPGEFRPRL
jgi:ABC-type branched-subunit amino acid transport system substrate-binding protein